jgi:chaperonin cofactor prefoldin
MTFTANDLKSLVRLLEEQPQSRSQLRTLLLLDDLQAMPERFDRLTEAVEQLAWAQQRTEERLQRLETTVQALAEAQQRAEERLERLETTVQTLAEAQQRTEERLERLETTVQALIEAQQRTEERLEQLAAAVQTLTEAQQRTEDRLERLVEEVRELVSWQRGEAGRRKGERYEQLIVKRAPALFNGGEGGATDQPVVQQRLVALLKPLPALDVLTDEENPFLADLIWWKNSQFLVVEASLKVNGDDVIRAARRTETLQRANVQAMGLVVGEEWAVLDTRHQAEVRGIDWKVGDDLSEGLLAFRQLAS